MPRFPRLFDHGSLRRTVVAVGALGVLLGIFYWYQPQRYDLLERKPDRPLSRIDIRTTGLFEKGKKIVIVTGHPDDEAFYLGGTLFKLRDSGAVTSLIVMTDGDKAYYPFFDSEPLRKTRRDETLRAAARVGIDDVVFLGFPDGRLSKGDNEIRRLAAEIQKRKPELVLCSDPYYWPRVSHRDHRVSGEVCQAALQSIGFSGWALFFSTVAANTFSDVDRTWGDAQELLGVHESQFYGERLELIKGIVSERALAAGERFGVGFAEPFRAVVFEKGQERLP